MSTAEKRTTLKRPVNPDVARKALRILALLLPVCFVVTCDGCNSVTQPTTGTIAVRVLVDDEPLSGVVVNAIRVGGESRTATTDANGECEFEDLTFGTYDVAISGYPQDVSFPETIQEARIEPQVLIRTVIFEGTRPRTSSIRGVVEAGGMGLEGVTVTASGPDPQPAEATTDAAGAYALEQLRAGQHTVEISGYDEGMYEFTQSSQEVEVGIGESAIVNFVGQAVFDPVELTVELAGEGTGHVTGEGIDCPGDCTEQHDRGTETVLMAEPDAGFVVVEWSGPGAETGENEWTLTMDEDATVTVYFEPETGSKEAETGVFTLDVLTDPDGLSPLFTHAATGGGARPAAGAEAADTPIAGAPIAGDGFGPFDGRYPLAIAGAEGYVIIDLLDGSIIHQQTDLSATGPFFGVAGITQAPAGDPASAAMLLAYGENGYTIDRFDQFGVLAFDGPTVDAFPAGGGIVSDVMPFVQLPVYGGVQFYQKESASDVYTPSGEEYASFDGQPAISAYTHGQGVTTSADPRGPTLVVTNAANGGLYLLPRTGEGPQRAADLGPDARRVRCIAVEEGGDALVCAVTVFGQDALRTFTWDGEGLPVVADAVAVGDGPVGVSLRRLPDGRIASVTSGFNDSTITELVLNADGTVAYGETRSAPEGCEAVANVVYVMDDVSAKVAGACYGSDSYFVDESVLP